MIIGIDPGAAGAVAVIDGVAAIVALAQLPASPIELHALLETWNPPNHIFIEKAQAMPGQGTVSMFGYGVGYGRATAAIALFCKNLRIGWTEVSPQVWRKTVGVPRSSRAGATKTEKTKANKDAARTRFEQLWPGYSLPPGTSKENQIGMRDAALIAYHGYLTWNR